MESNEQVVLLGVHHLDIYFMVTRVMIFFQIFSSAYACIHRACGTEHQWRVPMLSSITACNRRYLLR